MVGIGYLELLAGDWYLVRGGTFIKYLHLFILLPVELIIVVLELLLLFRLNICGLLSLGLWRLLNFGLQLLRAVAHTFLVTSMAFSSFSIWRHLFSFMRPQGGGGEVTHQHCLLSQLGGMPAL